MTTGDDVIAALARERGRALVGYAYLLTGQVKDAEDLVQDAMVKTMLRSRDGLDLRTAEAYVRRTMLTLFIDGRRRHLRWRGIVPRFAADAARTEPDHAEQVTVRGEIQAALRELPPRERACVVLHYLDDTSVAEIGSLLDLSTGTVKRYLSNARGRLEQLLGPAAPAPALHEEETLL